MALAFTAGAVLFLLGADWFFVSVGTFLFDPVYLGALGTVAVLSLYWLVLALKRRPHWWVQASVSLLCISVLIAVFAIPVETIRLRTDFRRQRSQLEAVVARMPAAAATDRVRLSPEEAGLRRSGDEVLIESVGEHRYVLFFHFRSVNGFSGFLYVPPGGDVDEYASHGSVEAIGKVDDRWYMVREVNG